MKIYGIILAMVIPIMISGCLDEKDWDLNHRYMYNIILVQDEPIDFIIYCPVPLGNNSASSFYNKPNELINDMKMFGGITSWMIIESEMGYALEIKGRGSFEIEAYQSYYGLKKNDKQIQNHDFNEVSLMASNETDKINIYFESDSNSSYLSFNIFSSFYNPSHRYSNVFKLDNQQLHRDWQEISIKRAFFS